MAAEGSLHKRHSVLPASYRILRLRQRFPRVAGISSFPALTLTEISRQDSTVAIRQGVWGT